MDSESVKGKRAEARKEWRPGIGIVAHESAHGEALSLLEEAFAVARRCRVVVSPGLGMLCGRRLELPVRLTTAGVQQSAIEVAGMVSRGEVDAVVYLPNALANPRWDEALRWLVRACNGRDAPLATNAATARAVLAEMGARLERAAGGERKVERRKEETLDYRTLGEPGAIEEAAGHGDGPTGAGARAVAPDAVAVEHGAAVFPLRGELGLD